MTHYHVRLNLDEKLSFSYCINGNINKTLNDVGLPYKRCTLLPQQNFLPFYKSFIRLHFDIYDVIHDQALNESRSNRKESVQHKTSFAIAATIQGVLGEELYQKIGSQHLHERRWTKQLCLFYEVFYNKVPKYTKYISARQRNTITNTFYFGIAYFQNSMLPCVIRKLTNLI